MNLVTWVRAWWGRNLRRKLLIPSIATVSFSLILLGYLSLRVGQLVVQREVNKGNSQVANLIARDITAELNNISGNVRLLMVQLDASSAILSLQARVMLELRRASPITYRALYLVNQNGEVLLYLNDSLERLLAIQDPQEIVKRPRIPLPEQLSEAYQATREGNFYISQAFISGPDRVPMLIMGILLGSSDSPSSQREMVIAEIDLRDIWRRIDEIHIGKTGRAFVVSSDEIIIAHPDRAYIGRSLPPELNPVLDGYEGQVEYVDPVSGQIMLAAYSPIGGQSGWGVVAEQERAEALAPTNVIAFITLGVLVAALALATGSTILITQSITQPIQQLAATTQMIALTGDLSQDVPVKGEDEVDQLAATFNAMMGSLRDAQNRLLTTQAIAQELRIARQIQAGMLPKSSPIVPGLEITALCIPAQEIGGDFYDYYQLVPKGLATTEVGVAVGDVSGKGIPAALYMALSASVLAAKVQFAGSLAQLYTQLNDFLYPRTSVNRMNVALLYLQLSRESCDWHVNMINAGFIAPLLRRKGWSDYIDVTGLPLGVLPEAYYQAISLPLEAGDWLVLCSDGLVEAMNDRREVYGFERLQQRVATFEANQAYDLIDWIVTDVETFNGGNNLHDDMTVVVIHLKPE